MKVDCIDFHNTYQFGKLFLDYIDQKKELSSFYNLFPTLENIETISKSYPSVNRGVLVDALNEQYNNTSTSEATKNNITALLSENTFTITTGHQLNLATGPLFFVFKILSAIKTTEQLNAKYPNKLFVPVFWMASEDHDFEEINHFNLFGKQYTWKSTQQGAVGQFKTTGLLDVLAELPETIELLQEAYSKPTLSEATRYLVNELFKEYGLVILDADNASLKKEFSGIIKQELISKTAEKAVAESSQQLDALGYKTQVHPREINLFYVTDNARERIVVENDHYKINNTNQSFSEEEILAEVDSYPERFSPNVILRPVYQQHVLPNLSYIGGPGELAYWFQLKEVFEKYKVTFPVLQPRAFGLLLNGAIQKKIDKLNLNHTDLFKTLEELKGEYLRTHANDTSIEKEIEAMKTTFNTIIAKAEHIDHTLQPALEAEWQRIEKQFLGVEKRIKKAEERKHEVALNQLAGIKEKLFPNGSLQERHDNIFSYITNTPNLIAEIHEVIDPLSFKMNILSFD